MYSYHAAGAVTAKNVKLARPSAGSASLEVDYAYDQAGRAASVTYPFSLGLGGGPHTLSYAYDSMGRPTSLTDSQDDTGAGMPTALVQDVQYDFAGRLASLQQFISVDSYQAPIYVNDYARETRSYNNNGQLTSQSWANCESQCYSYGAGITYSYSATNNSGQITQAVDAISGETIVYQYDALKRLTCASTATGNCVANPSSGWTQSFQYDGFGNLTAKVLNGATTTIATDATKNQVSCMPSCYDLNGNMTSGPATMGYDEANRLVSAQEESGGAVDYGYDPANKRIYQVASNGGTWGFESFTFYGAKGEKLGVYNIYGPWICQCSMAFEQMSTDVWFGGKLIWDANAAVLQDRLGTNRGSGDYYDGFSGMTRFYPYGEEITSTANDREKFATYTRDSYTGFDYADQRFYASSYGRFNTADPYQAKAGLSNPGSWNRYSYVLGDPINNKDPNGTCAEDTATSVNVCDTFSLLDLQPILNFGYAPATGAWGLPVSSPIRLRSRPHWRSFRLSLT